MEDLHKEESVAKLKDLAQMYTIRLKQLGVTTENRIHTSRLKNRLLSVIADLKACSQGRDVILSFDEDISTAIKKACDHDSDAMHLARAAQVVRKEMFEKKFSFDGSFKQSSQQNAVPQSLLALVNMILDGPNIKHQTQLTNTTASLSISQLLVFNSVKNARKVEHSGIVHHSRDTCCHT